MVSGPDHVLQSGTGRIPSREAPEWGYGRLGSLGRFPRPQLGFTGPGLSIGGVDRETGLEWPVGGIQFGSPRIARDRWSRRIRT